MSKFSEVLSKLILPIPTSEDELAFARMLKERFSWNELASIYGIPKSRMRYILQTDEERTKHNNRQRERWRANSKKMNDDRKRKALELYGMSYSKLCRTRASLRRKPDPLPKHLGENHE